MRVTIIIPTYDRLKSLRQTIKSILEGSHKDIRILIVIDGNPEMKVAFPFSPTAIIRNEERRDWVFSMNRALKEMEETDAVLYASDDLKFPPNAISKAVAMLKSSFPDGDGLIGLKQSCAGVDSAFGIMGKKFIDRFPDRQVFCPDYIHYVSDVEIGQFAKSIGKFYLYNDVVLAHDRPKDKTRELGLEVFGIDRATRAERGRRGYLWGKNFKRMKE